jgi:hypothetical protein
VKKSVYRRRKILKGKQGEAAKYRAAGRPRPPGHVLAKIARQSGVAPF